MSDDATKPEPEAVEPEPDVVLPEGAKVVTKVPTGQWNALVGDDGENVLVKGKHVQVE